MKRTTFVLDLAAAVIVAVAVDRVILPVRTRYLSAGILAGIALSLSTLAVLPTGADSPVTLGSATAYIDDGITRLVPDGSLVLNYPIPQYADEQAMIWQAETGMHFTSSADTATRRAQTNMPARWSAWPSTSSVALTGTVVDQDGWTRPIR